MITGCDHARLSTPYCASCGKRNAVAREPGELRARRDALRAALEKAPTDDGKFMARMMFTIALTLTLDWALGEVTDEQYTHVVTEALK